MNISKIIRMSCVALAAMVALVGVFSQSASTTDVAATVGEDYLVAQQFAAADSATTLSDWQFTRDRPPKCRFTN